MEQASKPWRPSLLEGQAVPYARASQLLQELLGSNSQQAALVALLPSVISSEPR
jgi:hypothetical protein